MSTVVRCPESLSLLTGAAAQDLGWEAFFLPFAHNRPDVTYSNR